MDSVFQPFDAHTARWLTAALAAVCTLGLFAPQASAVDDLHVLTAGGTDRLEALSVTVPADQPARVDPATATMLWLDDGQLATYTDVVELPGGHFVLADGSGRGAVVFDDEGVQVDALDAPGQFDAPTTVAVASFLSENAPELLLMGDDITDRVHFYDVVDGEYVWSYSMADSGAGANITGGAVLPDRRIAVSAIRPSVQESTVEVVSYGDDLDADPEVELELMSHADDLQDHQVVVDELHPVRDVRAGLDGRLLVTGRYRIWIFDAAGNELWSMATGDALAVGGEFQTAHWVDDDLVAAATRQPGRWNEPHDNHRVHLLDTTAEDPFLASSPPLDAAPLQLESAGGHGATKTRGFYADALDDPGPSPEVLTVVDGPELDPHNPPIDETAILRFSIRNDTEESVPVRRIIFFVADADCDTAVEESAFATPWWSTPVAGSVAAEQTLEFDEPGLNAGELGVDTWCGHLAAIARNGERHLLGEPVEFEVTGHSDGSKPVEVADLGIFEDAGHIPGHEPIEVDDPSGCSCSSSSGPTAPLMALLFAISWWIARRCPPLHSTLSPQ